MALDGVVLVGPDGTRQMHKLVMQATVNGPLQDAQLVQWDGSGFSVPPDRPPLITTTRWTSTRFGACPQPGSTAASVVAKYGQKSFLRTFLGVPGTPPAKTPGASGAHVSWSLNGDYSGFAAGNYDAALTAAVQNLDPTYFAVEVLHELDNKVNKGTVTLALGVQVKNHAYDVIKAANPTLLVVNTLTGYAFSPNNTLYTSGQIDSRYGPVKADVIGADVDGIHSYPYPNMTTRAPNLQKFIVDHAASGYTDYAFPEWGTSVKQPQDQPDLLVLADWYTSNGNAWKAEPLAALWACVYDSYDAEKLASDPTRADDSLQTPATINAIRGLVAASVTQVAA